MAVNWLQNRLIANNELLDLVLYFSDRRMPAEVSFLTCRVLCQQGNTSVVKITHMEPLSCTAGDAAGQNKTHKKVASNPTCLIFLRFLFNREGNLK